MTFSVEISDRDDIDRRGHAVKIYIDKENLDDLISRLKMLSTKSEGSYLRFMSESWGPGDLSEDIHDEKNVITHHLQVIIARPSEGSGGTRNEPRADEPALRGE